ncbi:energy transducer TonB [Nonlabens ponticola]|uniref:TonB C-terminal domain-containing protein n=1 Tax=Nonlabens ponticola TaxID=2496866 RepID=A0A3S9MYP6_9FLAO|nr:energy transducer TonB [Nonlabens ponticola]AZQ44310.1 hypothetical protein EJ995_08700 [Nonlabens ponticola]
MNKPFITFFLLLFILPTISFSQTLDDLSRRDKKKIDKTFKAYATQDFDSARKLMNKCLQSDDLKDLSQVQLLDAHIYFAERDMNKAKEAYLKTLESAPIGSPLTNIAQIGISRSVERIMREKDFDANKLPKVKKDSIAKKKTTIDTSLTTVPFAIIERVPVYPGCDANQTNLELKACMQDAVSAHVSNEFDTDIATLTGILGKISIRVQFKIDDTGKVVDVHAKSINPILEEEAIRVVSSITQMQPGEQKGVPVSVVYALPIIFYVE